MPESRNPTETEDTNQEIFHAARLVFYRMIFLSCPHSGQNVWCNVCECLGTDRVRNNHYF